MSDILSLWRSPLDAVAFSAAEALHDRQPRCSISIGFATDFSAMTIYNYGSYVGDTTGGPTHNTGALDTMFSDMNTATDGIGGAAFIPQDTFDVNASSEGLTVPDQCDIVGSGGGGNAGGVTFYHFKIVTDGIFLSCSGDYTTGGKYFRSLAFDWGNPSEGDTCIVAATYNCRAVNCTLVMHPVFGTRS